MVTTSRLLLLSTRLSAQLGACVPPQTLAGGWACFGTALVLIGFLTALIGDLASHMGCCMGISKPITAITFVALGTSLPDTFASKAAALGDDSADAAIGNVTGSNSVNVFLGLGLPWALAAFVCAYPSAAAAEQWHARYGSEPWYTPGMPVGFAVPAGGLGFSVGVFTVCALVCLGFLMLRRATVGYELGGPPRFAFLTAVFFVLLWFFYIAMSVLYTMGYFH